MSKDVYIQIRIDSEMKKKIQAILEQEGITVSDLLRNFLEEYVGNHESNSHQVR